MESSSCCCSALDDLAVVPMGALDDLDGRVFATLAREKEHGGDQWWLYASKCGVCGQQWMVAQDERIHDNFYLKRLTPPAAQAIVDCDHWPNEFLTYEQVLRLGVRSGKVCQFLDPRSAALIETVCDLRRERPSITVAEIAHLLGISTENAQKLLTL